MNTADLLELSGYSPAAGERVASFLLIHALGLEMAIPLTSLVEVIRVPKGTAASVWFRGAELPLVDVRSDGEDESLGSPDPGRILVLRSQPPEGMLVSRVHGVRDIPVECLRSGESPAMKGASIPGLTGMALLGKSVVFIVDPVQFARDARAGR